VIKKYCCDKKELVFFKKNWNFYLRIYSYKKQMHLGIDFFLKFILYEIIPILYPYSQGSGLTQVDLIFSFNLFSPFNIELLDN